VFPWKKIENLHPLFLLDKIFQSHPYPVPLAHLRTFGIFHLGVVGSLDGKIYGLDLKNCIFLIPRRDEHLLKYINLKYTFILTNEGF
jgi:hypothetical protein